MEATLRRDGAENDWLVISVPELIGFAGTARRQSSTPLRLTAGDWPADVLDMGKHLRSGFAPGIEAALTRSVVALRRGPDASRTRRLVRELR
ncbi:hypothetical protein GCM10009808_22220 [Microbacterium sediminicola]|uniref:Uncharacterized protein n=1 Tax=Microbacterium sediminicola TaxID=415210 RepID=A0ABN2IF53_9MICO